MYLKETKPIIISIAGTIHGCGVTHLCVELATYISKILKRKVALLELCNYSSLDFLLMNNLRISRNMSLLRAGNRDALNKVLGDGYEYIILDIGCELTTYKSEFTMSDMRIVMLNVNRHVISRTLAVLCGEPYSDVLKTSVLMYTFGSRHDAKAIRKLLKEDIIRFPFEEELLKLNSKNLPFYGSLLEHIKR